MRMFGGTKPVLLEALSWNQTQDLPEYNNNKQQPLPNVAWSIILSPIIGKLQVPRDIQHHFKHISCITSPPCTSKALTVLRKFSLTPSEKWTLTLHCNSDWLCKQLKCEISQRLSRKPFDTLKKIRRDYTSLGGEGSPSKTVNFAFQTTGVGDFFFIYFLKDAWGKPLKIEKFCIFSASAIRPWIVLAKLFFSRLLIHIKADTLNYWLQLNLSSSALPPLTMDDLPLNAQVFTNLFVFFLGCICHSLSSCMQNINILK